MSTPLPITHSLLSSSTETPNSELISSSNPFQQQQEERQQRQQERVYQRGEEIEGEEIERERSLMTTGIERDESPVPIDPRSPRYTSINFPLQSPYSHHHSQHSHSLITSNPNDHHSSSNSSSVLNFEYGSRWQHQAVEMDDEDEDDSDMEII